MKSNFKALLGLTLVVFLSGCGQTQSTAEKACQEFKNKSYEAASKAFSGLARKNPAYMDQARDAFNIVEYLKASEQWKKDYALWEAEQQKPKKPETTKGDFSGWLDSFPPTAPDSKAANQSLENLEIFCK